MLSSLVAALAAVFGHGDDDHPAWLLAIRVNILLLVAAVALVAVRRSSRLRLADRTRHRDVLPALAGLSAVALGLRLLAAGNLLDSGGIPYSRMLLGYRGYFATAQAYSLVYQVAGRDIEHALLLNRLAGAATVPLVFALCYRLQGRSPAAPARAWPPPPSLVFPCAAAGLLALDPLHVLVSASDALTVFSGFLCALSWLLLASEGADCLVAGVLGLALLTQVRYENALLVLPSAILLVRRRRWLAAALCLAAGVAYVGPSLAAGISFQSHTDLARGWPIVRSDAVLFNAFLAVPFLFLSTLLVALSRRPLLFLAALAPWGVAGALAITTAERPHTVARGFSNWLVPLVIAAGYGLANLSERGMAGRVAVTLLGVYFAAKPVRYSGALRTRYLEMADHDAFVAMLSAQPPGTAALIVPDDDRLRRSRGATVETMNAYLSIREGLASPGAPLVGMTPFLEEGDPRCIPGRCLFYAGMPCAVEGLNPEAPPECAELARAHALEVVTSTRVTGAPFERCAVFVGDLRRTECAPTERTVDFTLFRVGRSTSGGS